MAHHESNGYLTDDVTWPWKVKVVTPKCMVPIISKMAGDRDLVSMERLEADRPNGKSNGHVLHDITCPVLLFETEYILLCHF